MSFKFKKSQVLRVACVLLALGWGVAAQAQIKQRALLTAGSGGELQIGTGLPLPIGSAGIFLGGMVPGTAGTFPPLLVPPVAGILTGGPETLVIDQNLSTGQGGKMSIPAAVLSKPAPGSPVPIAVFPTNPSVFQVATTISYAWPAAAATFAPGGAPGPAVLGTGGGGVIAYSGGSKAFGGPGQFSIAAGPGALGGRVGTGPFGGVPVASVWINAFAGLPSTVTMVGIAGASNPAGLGQPGAPVASPAGTTMFGPITAGAPNGGGVGLINQATSLGGFCTMTAGGKFCPVTPAGGVVSSFPVATFPSNMVTVSKGFPWSTGFITISQPGALPPEIFFLSGTDTRVAGIGNVSLVSGSLSLRALSGPNANRGWLSLTLPEPTMALGAVAALGMLGLCHGLVRRRNS